MRPTRSTSSPIPVTSLPRRHRRGAHRPLRRAWVVGTALASTVLLAAALPGVASAATAIDLHTAAPFAVLAGSGITDVPTSSITGDVGLSPAAGSDITGLTKSEVDGTIYTTTASGPTGYDEDPGLLTTAKNDLTAAFGTAAGEPTTTTFTTGDNQLGGQTLTAGVYKFGHATTANISASSPLTLNGQGDANAVFVFQATSDLVTASGSVVTLENGAQACNVFWEVDSSATLNSGSTFVGTLMALTSASLLTAAKVDGRVLVQTGAVTLDANTITSPGTCATTTTPTTTSTTTAGTTGTTPTGATTTAGTTAAGTAAGGATAGGTASGSTTAASGFTGSGGSAAGATPAAGATTSAAVVPAGSPHTGLGGAAHGPSALLIGLGALSLVGASGALSLAVLRRRLYTTRD